MGTNVNAMLPAGTRLRDVADVIGILLGCKKSWNGTARWVEVDGVSRKSSSLPEMVYINVLLKGIDNPAALAIRKSDGDTYELAYHFEGDQHCGPNLSPKSTAAKIALCRAVIMFFGGSVDYNDCDSTDVNFKVSPRQPIAPSNGEAWNKFQRSLYTLQPLTEADIATVKHWAVYKED